MVVWSKDGAVAAVISRKPIHLLQEEERKQVVKIEDMWLDIGAKSKAEAASVVRVGDPVTLEPNFRELRNGLASAPGMDNRCGLWVVMEAFRRAAAQKLNCALYSVSTVQEEIGLGATTSAFGIDPYRAIAVDVTHATDCPTIDKRQQGDIRLGSGPVVFRGPEYEPARQSTLDGDLRGQSDPLPAGGQRPGHSQRCQPAANQPGRRRHGASEHTQPLHAQRGGNHLVGGH